VSIDNSSPWRLEKGRKKGGSWNSRMKGARIGKKTNGEKEQRRGERKERKEGMSGE
jgi:hypothetical protein